MDLRSIHERWQSVVTSAEMVVWGSCSKSVLKLICQAKVPANDKKSRSGLSSC
jgi:hypothetical protein